MSKKRKQAERADKRRSGSDGSHESRLKTGDTHQAGDTPSREGKENPRPTRSAGQKGAGRPRDAGWISGKWPVFRFVGLFVILMALFYGFTFVPFMSKRVLPYYMKLNASASAGILNILGEGASASGTAVVSPRYSVDIRHGCDAIEPSALFIAAVLAFPGPWLSKLPGLLAGTVVLAIINLVRIVTLFYTGIYKPRWFEAMHVDVWQPIFILLALTLWVLWALWATRDGVPRAHAAR